MNELKAALSLILDLESGNIPLTRVKEGGIKDFLRPQLIPIVVRDNPVLRYTNGAARKAAVCFRSDKQLLSTFKGILIKDAAFDGLPEAPWQYEALYPGRDGPGFRETRIALKQYNIQKMNSQFFKSNSLDVILTQTVLSQQKKSINFSTFLRNHFEIYSDYYMRDKGLPVIFCSYRSTGLVAGIGFPPFATDDGCVFSPNILTHMTLG